MQVECRKILKQGFADLLTERDHHQRIGLEPPDHPDDLGVVDVLGTDQFLQ